MYKEFVDFITHRMRMSHVYQPVMLMTLLRSGGRANELNIARNLVFHDQSQIEYYTRVTNNMVGKVLRGHGIVERDRQTKTYHLLGFDELSRDEIQHLINLCEEKLEDFLARRGDSIYQHRRKSAGYIPGSLRYDVLKRAQFRCELCGISADIKALEVDHIIPRNCGGSDDISNLQALCYSHNAMKRDRDDTDFRQIRESYDHRDHTCTFCTMNPRRIIAANELAYYIHDAFPVTERHSLVIPKRHVQTYFELGQAEINACNYLLISAKEKIQSIDPNVTGFNIGMNNGESAGQTIFHSHIHLIPRRKDDVPNPRGGVRHVIREKAVYESLEHAELRADSD
jgi:ATP adenylyltransferase